MNKIDIRDVLFAVLSSILFVLVAYYTYTQAPISKVWFKYQNQFNQLMTAELKKKDPTAKAFNEPVKVQQIWIERMNNTTDRCITCHVGMRDPDMPNNFGDHPETKVLMSHPNPVVGKDGKTFLQAHNTNKMGCTVCHGGQGRATELPAAHGFVHHWQYPLRTAEQVQTSCNQCHTGKEFFEKNTPAVKEAMEIADRVGCANCHTLNSQYGLNWEGTLAPNISYEGSKDHTKFSFEFVVLESTPALQKKVKELGDKANDKSQYTDFEVSLVKAYNEDKWPADIHKVNFSAKHLDRSAWNWIKLHFLEPGTVTQTLIPLPADDKVENYEPSKVIRDGKKIYVLQPTMMAAITGQVNEHEADVLTTWVLSFYDPKTSIVPLELKAPVASK